MCRNHSKLPLVQINRKKKKNSGAGQLPFCRWTVLMWFEVAKMRLICWTSFWFSRKNRFCISHAFSILKSKFWNNEKFSSYFFTGNVDDASTSEANIKEEPVDPIELRRLQQLTSNGNFLNGNYQFPNINGNTTTFTPLTPASVHHQPGLILSQTFLRSLRKENHKFWKYFFNTVLTTQQNEI